MTNRYVPLLAVLPLAVYGVILALSEASGWSAVVLVVAIATSLPLLTPLWPDGRVPLAFPAILIALGLGIDGFLSGSAPTGFVADVTVGILLGAPLWACGVIAGLIDRPGLAIAALAELLGEVALLKATAAYLTGPVGTAAYAAAWLRVLNAQVSGLANAIASGGLGSPIAFPTGSATDPILILTAVLALAGVLLPLLPPVASRRLPPASVPRRDLAPPVRVVPPPVLNAPDATPTAPRASPGPTLAPVIGAVVAVVAFELVGAADPRYSFLVVTVAVVVALGALVVLGRWGVPRGASAARAAGRT
jgi:hypothetical protein